MHSGGSFGDLSAQDDGPMVDSTVQAGGQQAGGVGLHLRKAVGHGGTVTIKLENIKKERLKTVATSEWVSSAAQPGQGQRCSVKLPPIPAVGEFLIAGGDALLYIHTNTSSIFVLKETDPTWEYTSNNNNSIYLLVSFYNSRSPYMKNNK